MGKSTFSGPVVATNGFKLPVGLTADLPSAATTLTGVMRVITDNGAGDDEFAVVVCDGSAWVAIDTAALS